MNFSLVSYFSEQETESIRKLQETLFEITGSRKCLDDWLPHITVGDGIIVDEERLSELELKLNEFCKGRPNIVIETVGFGGIEDWKGAIPEKITPYVIWLDIESNSYLQNLFNDLRDNITLDYETWLPRTINYNPHITLAFADLTEEGYRKGMEYVKNVDFPREFTVSSVSIVECFGVGNMTSREYKRFPFSSNALHN